MYQEIRGIRSLIAVFSIMVENLYFVEKNNIKVNVITLSIFCMKLQ
jgi:hypothetical protein